MRCDSNFLLGERKMKELSKIAFWCIKMRYLTGFVETFCCISKIFVESPIRKSVQSIH